MACEVVANGSLFTKDMVWKHDYHHDLESFFWVLVYCACADEDYPGAAYTLKGFLYPVKQTPKEDGIAKHGALVSDAAWMNLAGFMKTSPLLHVIENFRQLVLLHIKKPPKRTNLYYNEVYRVMNPRNIPQKPAGQISKAVKRPADDLDEYHGSKRFKKSVLSIPPAMKAHLM